MFQVMADKAHRDEICIVDSNVWKSEGIMGKQYLRRHFTGLHLEIDRYL